MKRGLNITFKLCAILHLSFGVCHGQNIDLRIQELENTRQIFLDSINKLDFEINRLKAQRTLSAFSDSTLIVEPSSLRAAIKSEISGGKVIKYLNYGDKMIVDPNFYKEGYIKVCFDEYCGYVNAMWIKKTPEFTAFTKSIILKKKLEREKEKEEFQSYLDKSKKREAEKILERETARIESEKVRRAEILKKYGENTGKMLLEGRIWIGMTKEMALDSQGKPSNINRSVGSWGIHEQWVYKNRVYLYFENGKLTSWQD